MGQIKLYNVGPFLPGYVGAEPGGYTGPVPSYTSLLPVK